MPSKRRTNSDRSRSRSQLQDSQLNERNALNTKIDQNDTENSEQGTTDKEAIVPTGDNLYHDGIQTHVDEAEDDFREANDGRSPTRHNDSEPESGENTDSETDSDSGSSDSSSGASDEEVEFTRGDFNILKKDKKFKEYFDEMMQEELRQRKKDKKR